VEWRLVLKAAALAAFALLGAYLIGGGTIELLALLAGFGLAGYLATHRARNRPLVQGAVTIALALGAIFVGVVVADYGKERQIAKSMIVLTPFALIPGAVGMLAGQADRDLRPRREKPAPLPIDDLSRTMGVIWRGRKRREGAPTVGDESGSDPAD
jgi:hypothetical protein